MNRARTQDLKLKGLFPPDLGSPSCRGCHEQTRTCRIRVPDLRPPVGSRRLRWHSLQPKVVIFEPDQRAVIAFNGQEEILLLSADLRVSEPTKILQVLPLPSEPKVTKGDFEVFVKATNLINSKLPRPPAMPAPGGMGGWAEAGLCLPGRSPSTTRSAPTNSL